jgi:hypothetical protein
MRVQVPSINHRIAKRACLGFAVLLRDYAIFRPRVFSSNHPSEVSDLWQAIEKKSRHTTKVDYSGWCWQSTVYSK